MKPRYLNLPTGACTEVLDVLGRVGDKWAIFVIVGLSGGSQRFSELQRSIENVSKKMLTATLRNLERDGFIKRTVTPTVPVRVDYELTRLGHEILGPLEALADWAIDHRHMVFNARQIFDEMER